MLVAVVVLIELLDVVALLVVLLVVDVLISRQLGTRSRPSWQLTRALAFKPSGHDGGQDSPTCSTSGHRSKSSVAGVLQKH